jgi:betaine-aldehyde dehydrogenase
MEHKLWIDGAWADSASGGSMAIENPATGEPIAEVIDASRADVDRAVRAAHTAFYDGRWSKKTPGERSLALWNAQRVAERLLLRTDRDRRRRPERRDHPERGFRPGDHDQ